MVGNLCFIFLKMLSSTKKFKPNVPARLKSWWVRHFRESVDYWFAGTIQEPTEAAACVKVLSNYHRLCNLYRCQFSVALLAAKYWTDPSFLLVKRTVILLTFREEWQFVMNFRRPLCLQSHNWVTSSLWPMHNPIALQQRKPEKTSAQDKLFQLELDKIAEETPRELEYCKVKNVAQSVAPWYQSHHCWVPCSVLQIIALVLSTKIRIHSSWILFACTSFPLKELSSRGTAKDYKSVILFLRWVDHNLCIENASLYGQLPCSLFGVSSCHVQKPISCMCSGW